MFTKTHLKAALLGVGLVVAMASFKATRPYVLTGFGGQNGIG